MVGGALSETIAMVTLRTVPRQSLLYGSPVIVEWRSGCAGDGRTWGAICKKHHQKDRQKHCTTPRWQFWFDGSQPPRWRWKIGGRNNTSYVYWQQNNNCNRKPEDGHHNHSIDVDVFDTSMACCDLDLWRPWSIQVISTGFVSIPCKFHWDWSRHIVVTRSHEILW